MARNLSTLFHVRLGPYQDWPIGTKLIAFLIPLIVAITILGAWAVQARNQTGMTEKLTQRARSLHTQIMADREYYASVIVPRVIELGGSLGPDYRRAPGRFPLPATFVREVSELTATTREGYGANLISPWPINKDKGPKDQFQREGFAYLMRYPTGQFVQTDTMEGQVVMRVLMGDRASAQSCVDCHNAHAESPRRDFKLNDLMGGLEIVMPISQYQEEGRRELIVIVASGAGLCLLVLGVVTLGTYRTVTRPLATLAAKMRAAVSPGEDPATQAASVPSGDEVMQLTETFGRMQAVIGSQQTQLLEANAQLEDRVRERTVALRESEAQLRQSQKMEAVGQLAGGIAHDFNNLLTVINGYSELMLQTLPADNPHRNGLEQIKAAGKRAALLTQQILAFSRRQVLEPRVLDLNEVAAKMDKLLRQLIGEDINLACHFEPTLWRVKADPGQIEQVIMNLAVNARDAMPQGGKLTIKTANVELDQAYARRHASVQPGPYVMLAVSDTGIGMDAKTQARLFEPFFTTKEPGKGTGLGLATVYGIVKQSGGNIWVYSEPGEGTTFKIYLPRVEEEAKVMAPPPVRPETLRGSETILLVEDDEMVRALAGTVLQYNNYTVLEARNGQEALRICQEHPGPIHLLVTDVVMPGMSGQDTAIRLASLRPNMKILYMSGYTDNAAVHHGVLDAGTAFLQKPFTPAALAQKVRKVLDTPPRDTDQTGG